MNTNPHYPPGTSERLLHSEHVSPVTRERVLARLEPPPAPRFFTPQEYARLEAVCARLVPQPDRAQPVPIAPSIDLRLWEEMANGWRYDAMPPDREAFQLGLQGIEEAAQQRFARGFGACAPADQDAILLAVQRGELSGGAWQRVVAARFFEELLSEAVEIYYAHPAAQDEIGYAGFADVPGWNRIELNAREDREPQALEPQS